VRDTITYTDVLSVLECGSCHISFAIPRDMLQARKDDGRDFWCPNGCKIRYSETETQRLRKKLEREKLWRGQAETRARAALDQADTAERSARAYKGQVTKIKKRVAHGVCPCCKRTFQDVARHMAGQHPGFADGA
jgi:hypothetical protein